MAYGTLIEFARRLGKTTPTAAEEEAMQLALDAAAEEIDWELSGPTESPYPALVIEVNYDRAMEHWRNTPFGALNTGPDLPPVLTARDSWYRHHVKLKPLKGRFGIA